jgi:hypothetical protein
LQLDNGESVAFGDGDQVAVVTGPALEVFTILWNRGGTTHTAGHSKFVDRWTNLPGQLTGATRN